MISKSLLPVKTNVLKRSYLVPGSCVSVDHYMSSVMGCLPLEENRLDHLWHTLCRPCQWKLFNFCQYSTNAVETISSKCCLESLAPQEGISIKKNHVSNSVFTLNTFKELCLVGSEIFIQLCWGTVDIGLVESPFQHTCLEHLQDCVVNGN
jgi:hypothetical protein